VLTTFDEIFAHNKRLDLDGTDLDYCAYLGIFLKKFLSLWDRGKFMNFADNSKICQQIFINFYRSEMSH